MDPNLGNFQSLPNFTAWGLCTISVNQSSMNLKINNRAFITLPNGGLAPGAEHVLRHTINWQEYTAKQPCYHRENKLLLVLVLAKWKQTVIMCDGSSNRMVL